MRLSLCASFDESCLTTLILFVSLRLPPRFESFALCALCSKHDKNSWWDCVVKGDPKINKKKIVPENIHIQDLDPETQGIVNKMRVSVLFASEWGCSVVVVWWLLG
jgi:hypothetical protein